MPEPNSDQRAVKLFLIHDHTKSLSYDADRLKNAVDQKSADFEVIKREMFYLAVIVRDLATEVSRLALAVE